MEFRCGGLIFTSKFDSGNLARVERVSRDDEDEEGSAPRTVFGEVKPDHEFNVWTQPDCAGTSYENGNRSWFYFGVRGWTPGRLLKINIMNLNRQGKLYNQGHSPFVKTVPGKPKWERVRDRPFCETIDGNFYLSFSYRFLEYKNATTYFAFCYPWSYEEQQLRLGQLDKQFEYCRNLDPNSPKNTIYYHRELLCPSLDGNRIDLLTVSDLSIQETPKDALYYHRELLCPSLDGNRIDLLTVSDLRGIQAEEEPRFDRKLFPDTKTPRCRAFKGKRVYLVSSRVHPGETPASFVFNGFLDFVVNSDDSRAKALRRNFIIKMIPILNPDGVVRGHYRTDSRGVNLNRMYLDPDFDLYPSIYASKSVLCFHHMNNRVDKSLPAAAVTQDSHVTNDVTSPLSTTSATTATTTSKHARTYGASSSNPNPSQASQGDCSEDALFTNRNSKGPTGPAAQRRNLNQTYNMVYSSKDPSQSTRPNRTNVRNNRSAPNAANCAMNIDDLEDRGELCGPDANGSASELNQDLAKMSIQESVQASIRSSVEVPSAGEFDDLEDDGIGNEGSDEEGADFTPSFDGTFHNAPHLNDLKFREVPPEESGIAFYVDLHGHASKRGCFIYGNYFESEDVQVENMLFPKLISINTAHFDFTGCNFTERNMYTKDKKDGLSKEGAGRVAMYKTLGIIHSYTLECNYNTGRMVNAVPPAYGDNGRATPPPLAGFPPKYTQAHFEEVGKAMAIAGLDMVEANPWSRLTLSEFSSVHGVRDWTRRYLRGLRGLPRGSVNRPQRAANKPNSSQQNSAQGTSNFRGPSRSVFGGSSTSIENSSSNNRAPLRRHSQQSGAGRRELGPVRDPPRGAYQRLRRLVSTTTSEPAFSAPTSSVANPASLPPTLAHSMSAPVSLTLTSCSDPAVTSAFVSISRQSSTADLGLATSGNPGNAASVLARRGGGGGRVGVKAFLGSADASAASADVQSAGSGGPIKRQQGNPASSAGSGGPIKREQGNQVLVSALAVGSRPSMIPRAGSRPSPPEAPRGSGGSRPSGYYSDSVVPALARQPSTDSSVLDLEEEKIQQLRNIPSFERRSANSRGSRPLEPPNPKPIVKMALEHRLRVEQQVKRRLGSKNKNCGSSGVKVGRRSSSYSPGSSKGPRKLGSVSNTDSENERKVRLRRKKSLAKMARRMGRGSSPKQSEEESGAAAEPQGRSREGLLSRIEELKDAAGSRLSQTNKFDEGQVGPVHHETEPVTPRGLGTTALFARLTIDALGVTALKLSPRHGVTLLPTRQPNSGSQPPDSRDSEPPVTHYAARYLSQVDPASSITSGVGGSSDSAPLRYSSMAAAQAIYRDAAASLAQHHSARLARNANLAAGNQAAGSRTASRIGGGNRSAVARDGNTPGPGTTASTAANSAQFFLEPERLRFPRPPLPNSQIVVQQTQQGGEGAERTTVSRRGTKPASFWLDC